MRNITKQKIKTYQSLKDQSILLENRIAELREQILKDLDTDIYEFENLKVQIQRKDLTTYNVHALADLLTDKGLHDCFRMIPDEEFVEQAYYEGKLTDSDLRSVREVKKQIALVVERV